jgi:regulatory protein
MAADCMADLRVVTGGMQRSMASSGMREPKPVGPQPTESSLREAALAYLAKFSATEAGLVRVLDRRIERWARAAGAEPEAVAQSRGWARAVAARLVAAGVVDDAAFAERRAAALTRAGRSRRAVAAHLAARGVDGAVADAILPDDAATELGAALAFARRRRIGPFLRPDAEPDQMRALGMLARAGFSHAVALEALRMAPDDAEAAVIALRQA